jgi:Flp pilus assembly pilin Flp
MISLASSSVSEMFTIPANEWTVINQRVGQVLATVNIKDYITSVLGGYPNLLNNCLQWQSTTFQGLIAHSQVLYTYSSQAITDFGNLNTAVKQVMQSGGNTLPDVLQQQTIALLQKLNTDTLPIAKQSDLLSAAVLAFLTSNVIVDTQMATFKDSLGTFWTPLGDNINTLEAAAGHVTGVWNAITNDLSNTLRLPITVTIPFVESLNIDVAIASWQNIQAETQGFASMVAGQENYWTNPF